jgi:capsular polysaccharide biosynthesis protein
MAAGSFDMQMKPYQPLDVTPVGGDRIQVPGSSALGPAAPGNQSPSLAAVFAREIWQRKTTLAIWAVVTVVVAGAAVFKFAQPLYRAEGKLSYRPNYSRGSKPIYTPPNIQSAVQILKSADALEPVRAKHLPGISGDDFARNARIEVSKQSEFIDVSYDHPDPAIATAVANDLMTEGQKYFELVRVRTTKDAIAQVTQDVKTAKLKLEQAKDELSMAYQARGIADPEVEMTAIRGALLDIETQLRDSRKRLAGLKSDIKYLENRRDAPADPSDALFDDTDFAVLQAMINKLQSDTANQQILDSARIDLEAAKKKEFTYRRGLTSGAITQEQYDDVLTQIKKHEATLKHADGSKQLRADFQKKFDELKKKAAGGKPLRPKVLEELDKLKREETVLPGTIAVLDKDYKDKRADLTKLLALKSELGLKEEEVNLLRSRVQDFDAQLTDASERGQNLNANDMRVHGPALAGTTPYSSNAPKLGMGLIGASAALFVCYIGLFHLPRAPSAAAVPAIPALPKALVALVPYLRPTKASEPDAAPAQVPFASAVPDTVPSAVSAEPAPVRELAERIKEDGVDRGGIVLFSPTASQLNLAPAIGDLGQYFTDRGDRVLVFDARAAAEMPTWAGPNAPGVAETVEGYLDGVANAPSDCFVSTSLNGVEYSRADLSTRVGGVMAAHRFRQLVEEMRERYSLVFLVGPPVTLESGDSLLATLAEGMVLVTETSANPTEVTAYLQTLSEHAPARVYGTLAVPRA